ncbi:MAG: SLC13 family permease [Caldilineaceae bacterium]
MTVQMGVVFLILVGALVVFALDRYPIDFVAFSILALMLVIGPWLGLELSEVVAGFSNTATVTVMAMFVLSAAIARTGMINWLASQLEKWAGTGELRQLVVLLLVVGVVSAFLANTATVAILMPMIMTLARRSRRSPSKLLMPLSYGSQLGGVMTLIGTSTNILASSLAAQRGYGPFGMFEFTLIGVLVYLTGLLYFVLIGHRLLPERRPADGMSENYRLKEYLAEVLVQPDSLLVGKTLAESGLGSRLDIQVLDIVRNEDHLGLLSANVELLAGDILLVQANNQQLLRIKELRGLAIAPELTVNLKLDADEESAHEVEMLEVVLAPASDLIGGTLKSTNFGNRFNAMVIAMRKHGRVVTARLGSTRLEFGDELLLRGSPAALRQIKQDPNFIVGEQPPLELFRREKIPMALAIVVGVVMLAGFGLPILMTSMVGCVLMVISGCLKVNELHEAIRWDVIFLLAGVLPIGLALERTGGAQLLADFAATQADQLPPLLVLILFYGVAMLLTEFISNNATVVVLLPVAISAALSLGLDPRAFILAIMFAASTSFMTPVGYQTNTMIHGPGGYKFLDFLRVGAPLNLILLVMTPLYIYWLWGV